MKTKTLTLTILAALGLASNPILAEQSFHYDYATVLTSSPVYEIVDVTEHERRCEQQTVVYREPRGTGSLVGGLLGAAVGHALGSRSKHRKEATIVGAIAGASMASNSKHRQQQREETRCDFVPVTYQEERIMGYNVVYRYNNRTFESRLPFDPGASLKIRVVLTPLMEAHEKH